MHLSRLDHRATPLWLAALLALGCTKAPPPKSATLQDAGPVRERIDTGATYYEGEIGGMNEYAVDGAFKALSGGIQRCFESGAQRVETLGGSFTVSFRVDRKGKTRWAFMKSSTVGDRATENCILDLVRNETWPKPLSGEGLAQQSFEIEPSSVPHAVDAKRVRSIVSLAKTKTAACRKGVQGSFVTTAYLEPDGRVRTASAAPPDEKSDSVVDCVIDELQKLRFAGTGKLAKVTFEM
jgi:hypothetical protein